MLDLKSPRHTSTLPKRAFLLAEPYVRFRRVQTLAPRGVLWFKLSHSALGVRPGRQAHGEHRAFARLAHHYHVAAHHPGEARGRWPGPARCHRNAAPSSTLALGELLKQLGLLLGRHADAGIGDGQLNPVSRPFLTLLARSLTSPSFVNLQALLNRSSRICRRRMGST